jgi:DNA primase
MASWVDFATIKQTVSLLRVLEHYQITGLRRSGKDQWRGICPLHGGVGRDAFHMNTAKQLFHCFSCGAGGTVLDLVAALEQCAVREAGQKLASWWNVPVADGRRAGSRQQATVYGKKRGAATVGILPPRRGWATSVFG